MRKRNWCQYNKVLVQRGSLTFLIDARIMKPVAPKSKKRRGRPLEFSNQFIEMLFMIKIHFRLPYRQLEGFTRFFLGYMKGFAKVPTYSLTCKRAKQLALHMPQLSDRQSTVVIVDATGIKVQGEGEWKVKVHGKGRPRKWIKLHLAIDAKTQEIIGEIITEFSVDDGKAFPDVMDQVSRQVNIVIGDGGYDDTDVRELIKMNFSTQPHVLAILGPQFGKIYAND